MNLRRLFIRIVSPAIWTLYPKRQLDALQQFSMIEKDSGCQLLHCQRHINDPRLKAYLFQHILEEFYHGEIFAEVHKSLSEQQSYEKFLPREELTGETASENEIRDFFAYVQIGEQAVNQDFMTYANARLDPRIKNVFSRAGADEGLHEQDTSSILLALCHHDQGLFKRSIWKAKIHRWWNFYKQGMQTIGSLGLTLILSLLYFIFGGFVVYAIRRRLIFSHQQEFAIFCSQVSEFEARQK